MRYAPLSRKPEEVSPSRLKTRSSGLRISRPGDTFEREADRVAATVVSGRRVPVGTLGASKAGGVLRDPIPTGSQTDQKTAPQPNNYGDALSKVAEAFLKTQVGQQMVQHFTEDDPLVKEATNFVKTPGGLVAAGAAATGVIATLAATHQPLPAQLPAIPLDKLSSRLEGLKLQISYQGPVDHPTQAMVTLSYEGKSSEKKKKHSASDTNRAETARMAADQDKFRAGLQPTSGPEADQQKKEAQWIQDASLRRAGTLPGGGHVWDLSQMGKNYPQYDLHMRGADSTAQGGGTSPQPASDKKEETPVQRSALSTQEVFAERADVEAGLHSGGRPLDRETRRFMEDRIGFDFSKVRIHAGPVASSSATAVQARAYTVGDDIVFNEGHYAPHTAEGRRLLAHELTHVVQQAGGLPKIQRSPIPSTEAALERKRNAARRAATEMFLDLNSPSEIQSRAIQIEQDFEAPDASSDEYVALAQELLHLRALLKEREAKAEHDADGVLLDAGNAINQLTAIGSEQKTAAKPWTKDRPHRVEDIFPFDTESVSEWQGVLASAKSVIGRGGHVHTVPVPAAPHEGKVPEAAPPSEDAVAVTFPKQEGMTFQTEDGQRLLVWTVIRATRSGYTNKQITKAVEVLIPHPKPGVAQHSKPLHWVPPSNKDLPDWQQQIENARVGDKITIAVYPSFNRDVGLALDWAPDPRGEMLDAYQQGVLDSSGGVILGIGVFAAGVTALTAGAGVGLFLGGGDIALASGAAGTVVTEAGETSVGAATLAQTQLYSAYATAVISGPGVYNTARLAVSGTAALVSLYELGKEIKHRGHFEAADAEKAADALSYLYFLPEAPDPVAMSRASGGSTSSVAETSEESGAGPEPVGDIEPPTRTPSAGASEEPSSAAISEPTGKQGSTPGVGGVEAEREPLAAASGSRAQSGTAGGSTQTAQGFVRQWFRSKVLEMFMRGTLSGEPATRGTGAGGSDATALTEKGVDSSGTASAAEMPTAPPSTEQPADASAAAEGEGANIIDLAAERSKRAGVVQSVPRQQKLAVGDRNRPIVATFSDDEETLSEHIAEQRHRGIGDRVDRGDVDPANVRKTGSVKTTEYDPWEGDSALLGSRLGPSPGPGYQAHHIVASNEPRADQLRLFLKAQGWKDINDKDNGVWLPTGSQTANINAEFKHEFTFDGEHFFDEYFTRMEDILMADMNITPSGIRFKLRMIRDFLQRGELPPEGL